MSAQRARGLALLALAVGSWFVVADVTARLFDGPASSLAALAGGGLVGIFLGVPGMLYVTIGAKR